MSVTLKSGLIKYKDPESGQYVGINVLTDNTTAEQISSITSAGTSQVQAIQNKGAETIASIPVDYTNLSNEVNAVRSALETFTGNGIIPFNVDNAYFETSTVGATVNFNSPTASTNFEAGYVACNPGDMFTVSGTTGSAGRVWAFLDSNKKVVRRETENTYIDKKLITAQTGEVWLVINNRKASTPDAKCYFGRMLCDVVSEATENIDTIYELLEGYEILNYSLPSGSSVDKNWNNTYDVNLPSGTNLNIKFNGYSGSKFSRFSVFGIKSNDQEAEIKTLYTNTAAEINIVTSEAYKALYFSLVRSSAESPVSYSVYLKGDYGNLLGSDVVKLGIEAEKQNNRIKMLEAEQEQMVYTHFNMFDLCTFDDGYVYNSAGAKVSAEGNSVATPIRVVSGKTYYAKNTRCYFSFFIYDDGTNERIGESDSVYSGAFTPSKNGYAYLTTETGYKTSCVWTEDYSLYTSNRNATFFLPNKLELGIEGNHIFRVGTGREYTSILECLIAAEQYKNSIVYIDPGTYDMTQEFKDKYGNDYFTSENYLSQTNHRGCPLNNGVHVIGYGGVVVTGGLASTDSQDAIGDWSIFAAGDDTNGDNGYGFTLENITVKSVSQHIRYLIHDEYGATDYNYINKYINCHFIVYPGYVKRCIGGGLGKHGYILIDNCTVNAPAYDATIRGINYHNDAGAGALNEIYIKNCYIPNGTVGITWYGQTPATEKSIMYVNNCYLQAEPVKKAETASAPYENVDIVSWMNTIAQ